MASAVPSQAPTPRNVEIGGSEMQGSPLPSDLVNQINESIKNNPSAVIVKPLPEGGRSFPIGYGSGGGHSSGGGVKISIPTHTDVSSQIAGGNDGTNGLSTAQEAVISGQNAELPTTLGELIQRGSTANIQQTAQALGQSGLTSLQIQELLGGGKGYSAYGRNINTPEGQAYNKLLLEQNKKPIISSSGEVIDVSQFDFSNSKPFQDITPQFQGQETNRNFIPSPNYTTKDFLDELDSYLKQAENQSPIIRSVTGRNLPDPVVNYLKEKGNELTLDLLKQDNPQEVAIIKQADRVAQLKADLDSKYNNISSYSPDQTALRNKAITGLNNEVALLNALIEKSGAEYKQLPFFEQVNKEGNKLLVTLPMSLAKQARNPLSSTFEFGRSLPKTLTEAASGNPQALTDVLSLVILDRVGKAASGAANIRDLGLLGKIKEVKPMDIKTTSIITSPIEINQFIQTLRNSLGLSVQEAKNLVKNTDIVQTKLADGKVYNTIQISKLSSENAPLNAVKGNVIIYGFEKGGKGRLFARGVQEVGKEGSRTYTNAYVLDSANKGRAVEILEKGKELGSNNQFTKQETVSQSLARQYKERELTKQELQNIQNLQKKFDSGLAVGLNELKNLINIEQRLNGKEVFTDQEFNKATKGITTISQIKSFLKEINASDQLNDLVAKEKLTIRDGKLKIEGGIEKASTFGGLRERRALTRESTAVGRATSKPELSLSAKKVSRKSTGGLTEKQLSDKLDELFPDRELLPKEKLQVNQIKFGIKEFEKRINELFTGREKRLPIEEKNIKENLGLTLKQLEKKINQLFKDQERLAKEPIQQVKGITTKGIEKRINELFPEKLERLEINIKRKRELTTTLEQLNKKLDKLFKGEKPVPKQSLQVNKDKGISHKEFGKRIENYRIKSEFEEAKREAKEFRSLIKRKVAPLISTISRALTREVKPKNIPTPKIGEFEVDLRRPAIVQTGGRATGSFKGQGTYERTEGTSFLPAKTARVEEPNLKVTNLPIIGLGSSSGTGIKIKNTPDLRVGNKPEFSTISKTDTSSSFKVEQRPKFNQGQKLGQNQALAQKQEFKQLQENKLDTSQKNRLREKERVRPREPVRIRLNPNNSNFGKKKEKEYFKKSSEGFAPLVKVKGKFERLGTTSFKTREEALGAGEEKVFNDLSRSVTVISTKGEKVISSTKARAEFNKLNKEFRPSKQYGSRVLVQKNALSTKKEITQIQEARKAKEQPFKKVGARPFRSIF